MKVILPGHVYVADNVDGDGEQRIEFVRRRDVFGELLPEGERRQGILTQELLRIAIDRTLYLYREAPCDEDTEIVEALRHALTLYESRAARRSIERLARPEMAGTCPTCGHILCGHVWR